MKNWKELHDLCLLCLETDGTTGVSLIGKMPRGFPRGELLCETERGPVRSYPAEKIITWMKKNNLI